MEAETLQKAIELRELIEKKEKEVINCKQYSDNIENKKENVNRCYMGNGFSGWPNIYLTREVAEFTLTLIEKKLQRQLEELKEQFKNL